MIKFVRIVSFLIAVLVTVVSIFFIDAEQELSEAQAAYRSGDIDQAIRKARRANHAFSDNNKKTSAYYVQAKAAAQMNWTNKSADYLDDLLRLNPEHVSGLLLRGEIRIQQGDNSGALEDINKGLELASENISGNRLAYALSKRGLAFLALNQVDNAENDARKAIQLSAKLPEAYDLMSRVMEQKGDFERAVAACDKAYKLLLEKDRFAMITPEGQQLSERLVHLKVKYLQSK
ncbi:tetratricopeptide repeat protein [uncultured Draconibacterium sp.]|uniref:tetratricopeptide repeat protein n=1 Tax=uncultured Draconibacterium sp. TaxID=1573823 RepID=UPI0025E55559|nr:tetratricopeptide repeat protein [uncultured Draconibacterium sp.]